MAKTKQGGSASNTGDSNPKYLGLKANDGQSVNKGQILVRQRGTKILPGKNVGVGKDYTLFALESGIVKFTNKRKTHFNGEVRQRKVINVITQESN